jgi:flagellar hook protein FlgE
MSIISSFYIGASGLAANSLELSVVGDNIANSNTIGFKASRAAFEDVVAQSVIGGSGQLGAGTRVQSVQKILAQGAITSTGVATDLAIQGDGFFIVNGRDGAQYYTRAGQMGLDEDGFLVNLEGLRVQGFEASPTGLIGAGLTDLNLTGVQAPPNATETITLRGNLSADPSVVIQPPFDPADPAGTSNFSTTIQVFDSLGNPHGVDIHYRKQADGVWEWHATTDGANVDGGVAGTAVPVGTGTMTFDATGNLTDLAGDTITLDPVGSPGPQTITLNMGDPINAVPPGTGAAGMVQQSTTASSMSFIGQDGFGAGDIAGVRIDDSGNVVGTFTNGQTRVLGQIAVAQFAAGDQLDRVGGNLYATSATSGDPNIGVAGTGGRGTIVAGALEQSNVDLSQEFIRMIVAQRAFQANSKTIQTADQLLQELIQVKR